MKILILPSWHISRMEPNFFTIVDKQATALAKAGHDITLIYTAPYSWKKVIQNKKILIKREERIYHGYREIIVYRTKTHIWLVDQWRRNRLGQREIKRWIKKNGVPDVIHAHVFLAGELGLWVRKKYRVPLVITEHFTGFARKIIPERQMKLARTVFAESDLNIAVSPPFRELLEKETGAGFIPIPNMVNTELFHPAEKKPGKPFTFIFVGLLHPKKRPLLILEAFNRLQQRQKDIRLVLIGEGQLEDELKLRIAKLGLKNSVDMPGYCEPEKLPDYLQRSHCFVFPSAFETFGVAPVEALSCGLPIIVTVSGGPESYIQDGKTGFLVNPDEKSLMEAMEKSMTHQWDSANIRRFVLDRFSEKAVVRQLEDCYQSLLKQK